MSRFAYGADTTLVEQLLAYYPPTPDWRMELIEHTPLGDPLPEMSSIHGVPHDAAPVSKHIDYWRYSRSWSDDHEPTLAVREKVFAAVLKNPILLPSALQLIPQNERTAVQVAGILGDMPELGRDAASDQREVRAWVFKHSGMLREAVLADVVASLDDKYGWSYSNSMSTLWKVDPAAATKLCREMAESDQWKPRVVGAKCLWEHGDSHGDWRAMLIEAAGDSACPESVRRAASQALLKPDSAESDEWMLTSLQFAPEWYRSGFERAVRENPDFWIPKLVPFVGSSNALAHERAVTLLVQFNINDARIDALQPLLPWLKDADWADANLGRLRLVQSLDRVSLPESIDGLIYVLEHDSDEWLCRGAAEALVSYNATKALPVLKEAYERLGLRSIFVAIDQLNGYTTAEQLAFIEAYFELPQEEDSDEFSFDIWSNNVEYVPGEFYVDQLSTAPRKALFQAVYSRAKTLTDTNPAMAKYLETVALSNVFASEPEFLANCMKAGKASGEQLTRALKSCHEDTWNAASFSSLVSLPGAMGGCAAILSRDPSLVLEVLQGNDTQAQAAVLAAARISGDALPLAAVASIMEMADPKVIRDAGLDYLNSKEDAVTRKLYREVRDRFLREGLLENVFDTDLYLESRLDGLAHELRHRFNIQQEPLEVYGLTSSGTWGGAGQRYLLVFPNDILAVQDFDGGRMGVASVSDQQFATFSKYIKEYRIDSLPPLNLDILDGVQYNYIHHTGKDLHTVFMNNPPTYSSRVADYVEGDSRSAGIVLYTCLMRNFIDLFESLDFELSYGSQLSILLPREQGKVKGVWKEGDDLRVLIKFSNDVVAWQGFDPASGELTGNAPEPAAYGVTNVTADMHPDFKYSDYHLRHPSQVSSHGSFVRSGTFRGELGLWICQSAEEPKLLSAGRYLGEFVSSDGRWCAVPRATGRSWADPNIVELVNLETGEVYPVGITAADTLNVVCYLPSHAKFLVYRARDRVAPGIEPDMGPEYPEYYLLDPQSRESTLIYGDFDVLLSHHSVRPLQVVADASGDLIWGTEIKSMPNGGLMTVVGRYDRHNFKFHPVLEVPRFTFASTDMWVDAAGGMLYLVLNGDLVSSVRQVSCSRGGLHF
ncbi:MAG: HEAT repeat domain-containing protein [Opitutaceae bacterium]